MAIKKQDFYEGAALYLLARGGALPGFRYNAPFLEVCGKVLLLKFSTKGRSPWSFTFNVGEQTSLLERCEQEAVVIGLICGSDGVVALPAKDYFSIASPRASGLHVACYRQHDKHYEVSGPDGVLGRRIAPSNWRRLFKSAEDCHETP